MYKYTWDPETGGLLLLSEQEKFSKEPRPVYYKELDILGFDAYWDYPKDDSAPLLWAEANNYIYKGKTVAKVTGGALYTKPGLVILDKDPEPGGKPLQFVDIETMCRKNEKLMNTLVQDTVRHIYNTYEEYKKRIDVFYVAFSGGKDSVVALDMVQRALPHDAFKVVFGDTDMEFPTTLKMIDEVDQYCKDRDITFIHAKSELRALDSWRIFGPPSRKIRWCCTIHKTAPVINTLCKLYGFKNLHAMMMTGVRGDESFSRSNYDMISMGKKLEGQYSFHPILDWSSAEVFLHMFTNGLMMNPAYKLGFSRVGCVICPNSSERHEYMKKQSFPELVDAYTKIIEETSAKDLSGPNKDRFFDTGAWKTRLSGRELTFNEEERFHFVEKEGKLIFDVKILNSDWKQWYKTIGDLSENGEYYMLEYKNVWRKCTIVQKKRPEFIIENSKRDKNTIEFVSLFKAVLAKMEYCVQCQTCPAECPNRNISMKNGILVVGDKCSRCHACLKVLDGCLYYHSIRGSKDMKTVKGINRYFSVGVPMEWITSYAKDQEFEPGNKKTDAMFTFLRDAGMTDKRKLNAFGEKMLKDINQEKVWALLLCNLAYTPAFNWYINSIPFDVDYTAETCALDLADATKHAIGEFWNAFKVILDSNYYLRAIGFGVPEIESKTNKNGEVKKKMLSLRRKSWDNPDLVVILYSLYKFAEACGGYYQFSLETLLDDSIERDGVSPTQIFGLTEETMKPILNGLSSRYPDFISASFTLDLDNITLKSDQKSDDVLLLF